VSLRTKVEALSSASGEAGEGSQPVCRHGEQPCAENGQTGSYSYATKICRTDAVAEVKRLGEQDTDKRLSGGCVRLKPVALF